MILYPIGKWFVTPVCFILAIFWFRIAYIKRHETTPFQVRDLFSNRSLFERSKQQLLLEGIFLVGLGVYGIFVFFLHAFPAATRLLQ
jgi:hypothetical protein